MTELGKTSATNSPPKGELPPVKLTWYDGGTRMPPQSSQAVSLRRAACRDQSRA